jgi:hypothetical protein
MSRGLLAGVGFAVLASILVRAPAFADEGTVLADRWDATRINGTKAGYGHTVIRKTTTPDGVRIETTTEGRMEFARMGTTLLIEQSSSTVEREDGSLVSIRTSTKMSGNETIVVITFDKGTATIATTNLGQTREAKVAVPEGTVGPYRSERLTAERGFAPGSSHQIRQFVTDLGGPALATTKVVGPEEVADAEGVKQKRVRLDVSFDVMPIVASTWVTPEGDPVQSRVEMSGMVIETFRTTKEGAQSAEAGEKKGAAEVFAPSLIACRHLVPHPRLLDSALLHIKSKKADRPWVPVTDDRQTVERTEADGSILMRLARVVPPPGATGKRPLANVPTDVAPFLVSTSMLQADDPLIKSSMEKAVGGETDAWRAAQAIEGWVYREVGEKSLDVAFASALEVCRDKKGDCTEHAVLAAALCRAAGIPSRVVLGLEYLTGILGGHAWTEVWIEGRWYAIDATLGVGWADPLHLTLGRVALAEGTYGAEFASFMDSMSQIEVDVREATFAGRTIRFDEGAVRTEGGTYVNLPWGLAVRSPAGFTVETRKPAEGLSQRLADWKGTSKSGAPRTIHARAESMRVGDGLAKTVQPYIGSAKLDAATVDGRPALVGDVGEGAGRQRVAVVLDDMDSFFAFSLVPVETPEDRAFFDAFLAGVDLDAEQAVR